MEVTINDVLLACKRIEADPDVRNVVQGVRIKRITFAIGTHGSDITKVSGWLERVAPSAAGERVRGKICNRPHTSLDQSVSMRASRDGLVMTCADCRVDKVLQLTAPRRDYLSSLRCLLGAQLPWPALGAFEFTVDLEHLQPPDNRKGMQAPDVAKPPAAADDGNSALFDTGNADFEKALRDMASRLEYPQPTDSFLLWSIARERDRVGCILRGEYGHGTPPEEQVVPVWLRDAIYRGVLDGQEPVKCVPSGGGNALAVRPPGSHHRGPQPLDPDEVREAAERERRGGSIEEMLRHRGMTGYARSLLLDGALLSRPWSDASSHLATRWCAVNGVAKLLPIADAPGGWLCVTWGSPIPSLDADGRISGLQLRTIEHGAAPGLESTQWRKQQLREQGRALPRFFTFGRHKPCGWGRGSGDPRYSGPLHTLPCGDPPLAVWVPTTAELRRAHCLYRSNSSSSTDETRPPPGSGRVPRIGICEGALKPAVGAAYLGQPFIGAWGGDFKTCRALLEAIVKLELRVLGCPAPATAEIEIYPDAGIARNSDVVYKLLSVAACLTRAGYTVRVMYWYQLLKREEMKDLMAELERREKAAEREALALAEGEVTGAAPSGWQQLLKDGGSAGQGKHAPRAGPSVASPPPSRASPGEALMRHLASIRRYAPAMSATLERLTTCDIDDLLSKELRPLAMAQLRERGPDDSAGDGGRSYASAAAAGLGGEPAEGEVVALVREMFRHRIHLDAWSVEKFYEHIAGTAQGGAAAPAAASSGDVLTRAKRAYHLAQREMLGRWAALRKLHLVSPRKKRVGEGASHKDRYEMLVPLPGGQGAVAAAAASSSGPERGLLPSAPASSPSTSRADGTGDRDAVDVGLTYLGPSHRVVRRLGQYHWVVTETDINPLAASLLTLEPYYPPPKTVLVTSGAGVYSERSSSGVSGVTRCPLTATDLAAIYCYQFEQPLPLQPLRVRNFDAAELLALQMNADKHFRGVFDCERGIGSMAWGPPKGPDRDSWEFFYLCRLAKSELRQPTSNRYLDDATGLPMFNPSRSLCEKINLLADYIRDRQGKEAFFDEEEYHDPFQMVGSQNVATSALIGNSSAGASHSVPSGGLSPFAESGGPFSSSSRGSAAAGVGVGYFDGHLSIHEALSRAATLRLDTSHYQELLAAGVPEKELLPVLKELIMETEKQLLGLGGQSSNTTAERHRGVSTQVPQPQPSPLYMEQLDSDEDSSSAHAQPASSSRAHGSFPASSLPYAPSAAMNHVPQPGLSSESMSLSGSTAALPSFTVVGPDRGSSYEDADNYDFTPDAERDESLSDYDDFDETSSSHIDGRLGMDHAESLCEGVPHASASGGAQLPSSPPAGGSARTPWEGGVGLYDTERSHAGLHHRVDASSQPARSNEASPDAYVDTSPFGSTNARSSPGLLHSDAVLLNHAASLGITVEDLMQMIENSGYVFEETEAEVADESRAHEPTPSAASASSGRADGGIGAPAAATALHPAASSAAASSRSPTLPEAPAVASLSPPPAPRPPPAVPPVGPPRNLPLEFAMQWLSDPAHWEKNDCLFPGHRRDRS